MNVTHNATRDVVVIKRRFNDFIEMPMVRVPTPWNIQCSDDEKAIACHEINRDIITIFIISINVL